MKKLHLPSIILGISIGILCATGALSIQHLFAQEPVSMEIKGGAPLNNLTSSNTSSQAQASLTQEEIDKKLDEVLESQKALQKRLETILVQTRFLKASSGK